MPQLPPPTSPRKTSSYPKSPSKSRPSSPSKTSSTASSTKVITKKEQLAQMSPSITFADLEIVKGQSVLKPVTDFWNDYMKLALYEDEVVPEELKGPLEARFNTPMKTKGPIPKWSYTRGLFDSTELTQVLETVEEVVKHARAQRGISHEPQWVSKVVAPIMSRLQRLSSSKSADGREVEDLNISSVPIAPHCLCPTSIADVYNDADRKVDYGLAIQLDYEELITLQTAVDNYRVAGGASINQTQGWTAFKPIFSCTEVKNDARDPLVQLGTWIAAEFEKRSLEGYSMDFPIPAIAIYGDEWKLWIAYSVTLPANDRRPGGKSYRVQFIGPVDMGNTCNAMGVFKILHVLKAIVRWGLKVFEPQFQKNVLARYRNK
ncbi:MAG: hypothetical protein Q9196_001805 [Gyalolechia fulgens]